MKNIFISSTFIDMQAERDLVQERVLPALRDEARKYGDNVGVIDLRWGVDTSTLETEEGAAKVLKVCLDEIDRSHPYMLIFLGERYGTMMREDQIEKSVRGREDKYTTDDYVKSITALEVEYGALSEKYGELNHCVVCFREPVVHMLDGAEKALYAEHTEEGKRKLEALKERIKRDLGDDDRLITYSCTWDKSVRQLVDFASNGQPLENVLTNCFVEMFRDDWKEYESLSWQDKEQLAFRALMESKLRSFVGREALLEEYYQSVVNGTCPIILQGEVGSGKTAIMCKLVERIQKEGKNVFAFFSGVGSMSTNAESLVKQMVYYMENLLEVEERFGEENVLDQTEEGFERRERYYSDWIDQLRYLCYRLPKGKKVYVFIDALDQLYFDEHVEKLDFLIKGKGVQFVASCTNEFEVPMNAMEKRDVKSIPALNEMDAKAVAESILASYSRNAYETIEQEILKKKSIGSPLYISLLIQRLNMMDAEELRKAMTEEEIVALGTKIVREMPDDVDDAIVHVIFNAIEKIGENMAELKDVINYLAVSRSGLRVQDLQGVFEAKNITLPTLDITLLIKYLDTFFCVLEDGRINYTHKVIRGGLLKQLDNRREYEENIKNYLVQNGPENEMSIKEGMYFAYIFDDYSFAQKMLSHAYDTKNKELLRAIKDIAMEDEGYFLTEVVGFAGENQKKSIAFFVNERSKVFESSEYERKIKLCIGQAALKVCEKVYEESKMYEDATNLADCLLLVGREMKQAGDFASAEKYTEKAIECYEQIQKRNNSLKNVLGLVNAYMARVLLSTTSETTKEELYTRCMGMLDGFQDGYVDEVSNVASFVLVNMGAHFTKKGKFEAARRCLKKAVEYRKKLVEWIDTEQTRAFLCKARECLGDLYRNVGEVESANECYEECLKEREYLYSRNSSLENLRGLFWIYRNVGHMAMLDEANSVQDKQARTYFVKAVCCAEELYRIENSVSSLEELVMICQNLAISYMNESGMEEHTLMYCEKAQDYAEMWYKKEPSKEVEEKLVMIYRMNEVIYRNNGKSEAEKYCSDKIKQLIITDEEQNREEESRLASAAVYLLNAEKEMDKGDNEKVIEYSQKVLDCIGEDLLTVCDFNSLVALFEAYQMMSTALFNMEDMETVKIAMNKWFICAKEVKERFPESSMRLGVDEVLEGLEEILEEFEEIEDEDEEEFEQQDFISEEGKRQIEEADVLILFEMKCTFDSNEYSEFCKGISELEMDCKILNGEVLKQTFLGEKYIQLKNDLSEVNGLIIGKKDDRNSITFERSVMEVIKYATQEENLMLKGAIIDDVYYDLDRIEIIAGIVSWEEGDQWILANQFGKRFKSNMMIKIIGEADLRELLKVCRCIVDCWFGEKGKECLYLEKAVKYAEDLYEKVGDEESLREFTFSCLQMGYTLEELGRVREALPYYVKLLRRVEEYHEMAGSESSLRKLASCYANVGNILNKINQTGEALSYYEKALECKRDLYEKNGSNENLRELSNGCNDMGNVLKKIGQTEDALQYYEESFQLVESLYKRSRSESDFRRLLNECEVMGKILTDLCREQEAVLYYMKVLKEDVWAYEKVGSEENLEGITNTYNGIGLALLNLGRDEEALECFCRSMQSREELCCINKCKQYSSYVVSESVLYNNCGVALYELGRAEEALEYLEKSLQYFAELQKKNPTKNTQIALVIRWRNLAKALLGTNRLTEALVYGKKAVELDRELYSQDDSDNTKERVIKSHSIYADALFADNQQNDAYKTYMEALEYCKSVCEKNDSIPNVRILVKVLKGLYLSLCKLEQSAEAEEYLHLAKEEAKKLYERSGAEKDKKLLEELRGY